MPFKNQMIWSDSCFWKIALDGAWPGREQSRSQKTPEVIGMVYIIGYSDMWNRFIHSTNIKSFLTWEVIGYGGSDWRAGSRWS